MILQEGEEEQAEDTSAAEEHLSQKSLFAPLP